MNRKVGAVAVAVVTWALIGCGGADAGGAAGEPSGGASAGAAPALSAAQLERGIGPIDRLELGELDGALAEQGQQVFSLKCVACHKMAERYVGPPLGDVLVRRTPEFVMNMMLNPAEMVERHPAVREMLAQYMNPMPNQNLTREDARAVLEYLRSIGNAGGQ